MQLVAAGTLIAVGGLLIAEWRALRAGVWLFKPLASLGFVAVGLLGGALADAYGRWLLAGLCLCACGDVLLIPPGNGKLFLAGIGSFALGHVGYGCAFLTRGPQPAASGLALAGMSLVVAFTLRWLQPHLPADMRVPVRVYMGVIAIMVASAVGASVAAADPRLAVGALAFAASDLSVARERFVRASFANLLWGLPLYYVAQLLLASSR